MLSWYILPLCMAEHPGHLTFLTRSVHIWSLYLTWPDFMLACQKSTFENEVHFQPKHFHVFARIKIT